MQIAYVCNHHMKDNAIEEGFVETIITNVTQQDSPGCQLVNTIINGVEFRGQWKT